MRNLKRLWYKILRIEPTVEALINGSFEEGPVFPTSWIATNQANVNGWSTTASDEIIELWKSGFNPGQSQTFIAEPGNGDYFCELFANLPGSLYQQIVGVNPGDFLRWSLWHRGRNGVDVMGINMGGPNVADAVEIAQVSTGNLAWVYYEGEYIVPEGQFTTFFRLDFISAEDPVSAGGNLIDALSVLKP